MAWDEQILDLLDGIVSLSTGAADNDKLVTQGYADDAVAGAVGGTDTIELAIEGNGFAIVTGAVPGIRGVPFNCNITGVRMVADQSTTSTVDVLVDGASITASAEPALAAATESIDTTLTGWTTALVKGTDLSLEVDANDNALNISIVLSVTRT